MTISVSVSISVNKYNTATLRQFVDTVFQLHRNGVLCAGLPLFWKTGNVGEFV